MTIFQVEYTIGYICLIKYISLIYFMFFNWQFLKAILSVLTRSDNTATIKNNAFKESAGWREACQSKHIQFCERKEKT